MDSLLAKKSLPPGIRFHPTDEELFMYYLKRKVMGKTLLPRMLSDVDVYRFAPGDLPNMSYLKTRDLHWYFFCPRAKKYSNGGRANRATEHGFWKSTGNDRTVEYHNRPVGKIKTLIFHRGKAPKGERTNWVMHEYRLEDKLLAEKGIPQDAYVICKIYKKSGLGPKNGEHYGAPFVEEEWESDSDDNVETREGRGVSDNQNASAVTSAVDGLDLPAAAAAAAATAMPSELPPLTETPGDELDRCLSMFIDDDTLVNGTGVMPDNDIYTGLGDLAAESHSSSVDFDWSQFLFDNGDCYMELNDLNNNVRALIPNVGSAT